MKRHATTAMLTLLGVFSYAQAITCKKGIQCGNTCISASYTCHVGPPVTAPVTPAPVQILTSPPVPAEPSGTYFGWSVVDSSAATTLLSRRTTPVPLSIGYSKQLSGLTLQEARTKIDRLLADEIPSGVVVFQSQVGTSYQWLARRSDGSRGVLIFADTLAGGVTLRVSVYSASSTFDLPEFVATTRENLLAQVSPASSVQTPEPVAAPAVHSTGPLNIGFNSDNMFIDPDTGTLIIVAQCQPFTFTVQPSQAFSRITLMNKANSLLMYSLDVTVDGKLRFTQNSAMTELVLPILVGQQSAGAVVRLSYKPNYASVASTCQGTLNISLKVE